MVGSPWPGFGDCESGLWAGITLAGGKHNPSNAARQAPCPRCHSRFAGMDCLNHPACRGQVDSGLRRAATGILGGLFQTPPYHLRPVGVPSRRIQDFLSINDGGGYGQELDRNSEGVIAMTTREDAGLCQNDAGLSCPLPACIRRAGLVACFQVDAAASWSG